MNIQFFCFFPQHLNTRKLNAGCFFWKPLEGDSYIVFNIRADQAYQLAQQSGQPYYFYSEVSAEAMNRLPHILPVQAIKTAVATADKAIEERKERSAHYRCHFDWFFLRSLQPRLSGYQDWLMRSLIYRGLSPAA